MTFAPKHIVTMVACVCAASVLAPVGVMAATGQLVNIADPLSSGRVARVSTDGVLRVESRAGANSRSFAVATPEMGSLSFTVLTESVAPYRIAVTDLSIASDTGLNQATAGFAARIEFVALTRTSGTAVCAYNAVGWTRKTMRWVSVPASGTVALNFAGTPLLLPAIPAGGKSCLGMQVWVLPNNASLSVGLTGYIVSL
jgi:hypothetical protein